MDFNELYEAENVPQAQEPETVAPDAPEPESDFSGYMDGFRAPSLDAGDGADDAPVEVDPETGAIPSEAVDVELIGKAAFYTVFKTAFNTPPMFLGADWQPLAIQPHEEPVARDASDAIYEILEIYYPAALTPQSEGFARIMRAVPFLATKVMIVRMILQAKRAEKLKPVNEPEFKSQRAANTNAAPSGSHMAWMDQEAAA